jgi:hypothetical protein
LQILSVCLPSTVPSRYCRFCQSAQTVCLLSTAPSRYCRFCQSLHTICNSRYPLQVLQLLAVCLNICTLSTALHVLKICQSVHTVCILSTFPSRYCRFLQSLRTICNISIPPS